jgi:hypothetical protein
MKNPFKRAYNITLNKVHDTVKIKENGDTLTLVVNADPVRMVAGLNKAQAKLQEITQAENPSQKDMNDAAELFAGVIFGTEQARQLMAFYGEDAATVINVCGNYFKQRLGDKISKVQKKMKL